MSSTVTTRRRLAPRLLAFLVVLPVLASIAVGAFTWASAGPEPHDLPIGMAGPPDAIRSVGDRLGNQDGAFDLHEYDSAAQAREAIEDREVYGALVHTESGRQVLTASAASPAVAQVLTKTFATPAASGNAPAVVDIVPADADDPRGSALGSMVLPLVLVSVVTSVLVLLMARPGWDQVAMIAVAAVVCSLLALAIAHGGFGILQGSWALNLVAPFLTIFAIAGTIVGAVSAFGRLGFVAVAPVMIFLGNPWSGATSSPYLLPEPAGLLGQLLPPGAGATALRSFAFFDGAGSTSAVVVLLAWTAIGLTGILVGALRRRDPARELKDSAAPLVAAMDR